MGPLTAAEKLELDATTLEAWKESHGVKQAFSSGASAYRGVFFECVATREPAPNPADTVHPSQKGE